MADNIVGTGKVICPLHTFPLDLATGREGARSRAALAGHPATVSPDGQIVVDFVPGN